MLYQRGRASLNRIERVLAIEPGIREPVEPASVTAIRGDLEVRDLTFRFTPDGPPVLQGIDLHVPAGSRLGLVGRVGCGKSALLQLFPRLYDPPPGTVFVDGHDVRTLPLDVLRTWIGAVPQDGTLFSETIRENIALGHLGRGADVRAVEESARIAQVESDVLAFPKGYETLLGERGVNLSGGQKQRVALARALARRPAILLLDDCLSAVDTETEAAVLRELDAQERQCTVVISSHRVSAVKHADEILVLAQGRIVERGTHAQLLALGGHYAELYEKQQLESDLEEGGR
jgi:ATP-binding cassette subfamily B protein